MTVIQYLGSCVAAGLGWWLVPTYPIYGWRYLTGALSLPLFVTFVFRVLFPYETPRFLVSRGKYAKAEKILEKMAKMNGKDLSEIIPPHVRFRDILEVEPLTQKKGYKGSLRKILEIFKPPYLRITICLVIIIVIHVTGNVSLNLFAPGLLKDLNVSPYLIIFTGVLAGIPGLLITSMIAEWPYLGRRNTLRLLTVMAIVFFLLFAFVQNEITIPLFTVLLYFTIPPMIPLMFTYTSESYPTDVRSQGIAVTSTVTTVAVIGIPYLGGYLVDLNIPWLFPSVWAAIFGVQLLAALCLKHETREQHLSDNIRTATGKH